MYAIEKHPSGDATVTVGDGPIDDLLDVIDQLRTDATAVKVVAAGPEFAHRAELVDRLLYDVGFDVR
ncbi:MAG TPA: hypothetical protein VMY37_30085 [Thermoguttaceae bacterium]|nr:hypothetical protein [Phycisphaerae bacterium]HUT93751.1 hypothetical protein [Thermoguttaceae bacterium]